MTIEQTSDYRNGYERGLRQEHLTDPDLSNHDYQGIAELATKLGYTGNPENYYRPTPERVAFIKGYCKGFYGTDEPTSGA